MPRFTVIFQLWIFSGLAFDGPYSDMESEVNYQADTHTVTLTFTGFESSLHGVMNYDWAVGTEPGTEDIQPYMEHGIVHTEEDNVAGDGR